MGDKQIKTGDISTSLYFKLPEGKIKANTIYKNIQSIMTKFGIDDGYYTPNEISVFNEKIKSADLNGDDVIDEGELSLLLKEWNPTGNLNTKDIAQAMITMSADLMAEEMFVSQKNYDIIEDLVNKFDEHNIIEIFDAYAKKSRSNSTFIADIAFNFSKEEASSLFKKTFEAMKKAAEIRDIDIDIISQKYGDAEANLNLVDMSNILIEIGTRLAYSTLHDAALYEDSLEKGIVKELKEKKFAIEMSEDYAFMQGIEPSDDLAGDGILGNTDSAAETKKGKLVLGALTTILEDPSMKEKLQAVFKKQGNSFVIYNPNNNQHFVTNERYLLDNQEFQGGSVGDGDITALSAAIRNWIQVNKIRFPKNEEDMVELIKEMFHLNDDMSRKNGEAMLEKFKKVFNLNNQSV